MRFATDRDRQGPSSVLFSLLNHVARGVREGGADESVEDIRIDLQEKYIYIYIYIRNAAYLSELYTLVSVPSSAFSRALSA